MVYLEMLGQVVVTGMLITAFAAWPCTADFGLVGLVFGLMLVGAVAGAIDVGVLTLKPAPSRSGRTGSAIVGVDEPEQEERPLRSALAVVLVTWSPAGSFAVAALTSLLAAAAVALIPREDGPAA